MDEKLKPTHVLVFFTLPGIRDNIFPAYYSLKTHQEYFLLTSKISKDAERLHAVSAFVQKTFICVGVSPSDLQSSHAYQKCQY